MGHYSDIPLRSLKRLSGTMAFDGLELTAHAQISSELDKSNLFDREFYLLKYPDVAASGMDPLIHYSTFGWKEGRNPNLWFDSLFYRDDNPDIAQKLQNPLLHFIQTGFREGRRPNPEQVKVGRRLVVALLAGRLPLHDIWSALKIIQGSGVCSDRIIIDMASPTMQESLNRIALTRILETGVELRTHISYQPAVSLFSILTDFRNDILVLADPLLCSFCESLRTLRDRLISNSTGIQSIYYAFPTLENGSLTIKRWRDTSHLSFAIPLVPQGILVPPGGADNVIKNASAYGKYAPHSPSIWFGVQALLETTNGLTTGDTDSPQAHAPLSITNDDIFKKELLDTLIHFRRELSHKYNTNINSALMMKDCQIAYEKEMGVSLDWDKLNKYGERLQYLKLFDDLPLKTVCADKYLVRKYIKYVVGESYLIPLLGVWKTFDDINFDQLPNEFVLKTTHGSQQISMVHNKGQIDKGLLRDRFKKWLSTNLFYYGYELNYFDIEPLIIAERSLGHNISDYKVMCFRGKAEFIWVDSDRFTSHKRDFYTLQWEKMSVVSDVPNSKYALKPPKHLSTMIHVAEALSAPFAHARIDFYILPDDSLKVGEITFYSWAGYINFQPHEFDYWLGSLIPLLP